MMSILKYGRISKKTESYNFDGQNYEINKYCCKKGLKVVGGKKEIRSGFTLNRPSLKKLLEWRRKENIGGIIVASVDRLSRNADDIRYLMHLAEKENFIWFFARENISTKDNDCDKIIVFYAKCAQQERENISKRIKASLGAKKERNEKTGGIIPYGKNISKDGKLTINIDEQNVIKLIVKLREKNELSYSKITSYLNNNKIPAKKGGNWNDATVRRIYLKFC